MRLGRDPACDIVLEGPEAAIVSTHHLEIRKEGESYRLLDLNSTNGTYLDGKKVPEANLAPHAGLCWGPGDHSSSSKWTPSPQSICAKRIQVSSQSVVRIASGWKGINHH